MVKRHDNPTDISVTLIYSVIEYRPARKSCAMKAKFASEDDAIAAAERHNRRVVCSDMHAYWCRLHWAWHIGHDNRRRNRLKNARMAADIAWFRWWWRASQTGGKAA